MLQNLSLLKSTAYINGEWVSADNRAVFAVTNPADGKKITDVTAMGKAETERAIQAANTAFASWRKTTAKQRAAILQKWYGLIMQNQEDLALLMTLEQGKPLVETRGEIAYSAAFIEWFAEEGKRAYGRIIPTHASDRRLLVTKEPIGVCALITPWNFPSAMITRKAAPALAAGCCVIVKPAAETPLSALALAVLAQEAGIPPGVFNVVTTKNPALVGEIFCTHPIIRKVSFTGSTEVGKLLYRQCSSTVKKISLELGGNAPFIVFDDADLDAAVAGAMISKYRNSGQTCVCANRLYVQDGIFDEFNAKLCDAVKQLKVGVGTLPGVDQGPLINEAAVLKVEALLQDAKQKGAKIEIGGRRHELGGTFFEPTIISQVTADMRLANEEIFGPVAPVFRFKQESEAIAYANATEYGLAAYFYSQNLARVWRVVEALEYGMVAVNEGILSAESAPFGGIKESGIGREGGQEGLEEYLETKYVCLGGIG